MVTWDFEQQDDGYRLYKKNGKAAEFYQMRPNPTDRQRALVSVFYDLRRDAPSDHCITAASIAESARLTGYEPDIARMIIQRVDDHYMQLIAAQRKKAMKQ